MLVGTPNTKPDVSQESWGSGFTGLAQSPFPSVYGPAYSLMAVFHVVFLPLFWLWDRDLDFGMDSGETRMYLDPMCVSWDPGQCLACVQYTTDLSAVNLSYHCTLN